MNCYACTVACIRSAFAIVLLTISSFSMADVSGPAAMVGIWVTGSDEVVSIRAVRGNKLEMVFGEAADGRVLARSKLRQDNHGFGYTEFVPVKPDDGFFRRIAGKYAYLTLDGYLIWRRSADEAANADSGILYDESRGVQTTTDTNQPRAWRRKGSHWPQYLCHGEKWKAKVVLTGGFQGRLTYAGSGVECDLALIRADFCPKCRGTNDIVEYRVTNCRPDANGAPVGAEDGRHSDPIQRITYSVARSRYFTGIGEIYATPIASHMSRSAMCSLISELQNPHREVAK